MSPVQIDMTAGRPAAQPWVPAAGVWGRLRHGLAQLRQRRRQRLALAQLDGRLLSDIGVTREQAQLEARKPFWRA